MGRILPVFALFLLAANNDFAIAQDRQSEFTQVDLTYAGIAKKVYVGEDRDMPLGSGFEISIYPSVDKSGRPIIPGSIAEALQELKKALPHWLQQGLLMNNQDHGCGVVVATGKNSETDEMLLLTSWLWVNWKLDSDQSSLRREFEQLGLDDALGITSALRSGFCKYLKTGTVNSAIDEFKWYAALKRK